MTAPRRVRRVAVPALVLAACAGITACVTSTAWRGAPSDHFDGAHFLTPAPFDIGPLDLLRYWRESTPGAWTRDLSIPPGPKPQASTAAGELRVTFVNHATVLIQADGVNLLTDPIWSDRASPLSFAGPERYRPPAINFDDLPRIDAVLVSHNHYDHFDLPTLRRLEAAHHPAFLVPPGDGQRLRDEGFATVVELDWWQSYRLPNGCAIHAAPAQHWSSRAWPGDRNRSFWLAYVVETVGGPVYFAGDTGYGPHFRHAFEHYGPMRLALLPIGAYLPRWLTEYQHVDPAQAVQAHVDLEAVRSLGIHYGTFDLADDGQTQPVTDLAAAVAAKALPPTSFTAAEFGVADAVHPMTPSKPCPP